MAIYGKKMFTAAKNFGAGYGKGAVQLLRNALGEGVCHCVTLCDRGGGSAVRYVSPASPC